MHTIHAVLTIKFIKHGSILHLDLFQSEFNSFTFNLFPQELKLFFFKKKKQFMDFMQTSYIIHVWVFMQSLYYYRKYFNFLLRILNRVFFSGTKKNLSFHLGQIHTASPSRSLCELTACFKEWI